MPRLTNEEKISQRWEDQLTEAMLATPRVNDPCILCSNPSNNMWLPVYEELLCRKPKTFLGKVCSRCYNNVYGLYKDLGGGCQQ